MANAEVKPWSPATQKWVIASVLTLAIVGLLYWNYSTFWGGIGSANTASPDCIATKAKVIDVHGSGNVNKSRSSYYVSYQYAVDGQQFENKEQVTLNVYNRTRLDEDIEICYMKRDPGTAAILGNDIRGENAIIVILADLALLIVIGLAIRSRLKKGRQATS